MTIQTEIRSMVIKEVKSVLDSFLEREESELTEMFSSIKTEENKWRVDLLEGVKSHTARIEKLEKWDGNKRYYSQDNIGSSKYSISFHDGKGKHKDGSDFYGLKLFKNKKKHDAFENELLAEGYTYRTGGS